MVNNYITGTPTVPRNVVVGLENEHLKITWQDPQISGSSNITHYLIYRGTSSGVLSLLKTLGVVNYYNDMSVQNGITYYYQVSAMNLAGEGNRSDEVSEAMPSSTPWYLDFKFLLEVTGTIVGVSSLTMGIWKRKQIADAMRRRKEKKAVEKIQKQAATERNADVSPQEMRQWMNDMSQKMDKIQSENTTPQSSGNQSEAQKSRKSLIETVHEDRRKQSGGNTH